MFSDFFKLEFVFNFDSPVVWLLGFVMLGLITFLLMKDSPNRALFSREVTVAAMVFCVTAASVFVFKDFERYTAEGKISNVYANRGSACVGVKGFVETCVPIDLIKFEEAPDVLLMVPAGEATVGESFIVEGCVKNDDSWRGYDLLCVDTKLFEI